jgi:hypothetical protein
MTDDLVKRLRDFDPHNMHEWEAVDLAAARIEKLEEALAELSDMVRCRCDEAYRDRGLHDPQCQCDSMDAVRVVIARIEWLERERVLDAKLLAGTQALLDKALEVLRESSSFLWHMTNAIDDEDYKGPHDGFNVPLVCHVQPYHDLHVEQLKTQAEKVDATLADIEGKKDE